MTTRLIERESQWNTMGVTLAVVVSVELAYAFWAAIHPALALSLRLGIAAPVAIVTVVTLSRAQMPAQLKATLIVMMCVGLLGLAAMRDVFGLRAINGEFANAIPEDVHTAPPAIAGTVPVSGEKSGYFSQPVRLEPSDTSLDPDFAEAVSNSASSQIKVSGLDASGSVEVTGDLKARHYKLAWAIEHDGQRHWCGRLTLIGGTREHAISVLGGKIARAVNSYNPISATCI